MSIEIKEIVNRKYDGKQLVAFEYVVKNLQGHNGEPEELRIWFEKREPLEACMLTNNPVYEIYTIINDVVYRIYFVIPNTNMKLELIAATGLNMLKQKILEEISQKETICYSISDIIKDM